MGKLHREKRKKIKARLRQVKGELIRLDDHRKFENEFGELKTRMTKAEARRRLLFRRTLSIESAEDLLRAYGEQAKYDIIRAMTETAVRAIQEKEDRAVFAMLDQAANEAVVDYVHDL